MCNFRVINLILFLEMFQREDQFSYKQQEADWSRETRGKKLIQTIHIGNWVLLHTQRDSNIANDFKQTLQRVCGPMGMNVNEPVMYVFVMSLNGDLWHIQNVNSGRGMNWICFTLCIRIVCSVTHFRDAAIIQKPFSRPAL